MTEVFVNDVGWVDVSEEAPAAMDWPYRKWTEQEIHIVRVLLPRYTLNQIGGVLDRTEESVRRIISKRKLAA